ncbi:MULTISPECIES: glycosyltransferase family 9 protein [Caballeronia]|uniref:glycosyltransferase family 9 protein n=1 Tax=Caballeronia TaxID=1827195 RepID=UPI00045F0CED|nr:MULTISPECIES: glycosyltransferase family 9 protein [unclassified Caballeronia]MCE4547429.1 glycosyltransferase family 9 protein [Caballeronia sp. PC1]MCE4575414.1 glycosyltransferase family 9 protein [Caballeronia sp. CLC5]BAO92642.1 glycosyl transferase family 9 [Burkholderia sp. RPE67]
MIERIVIFRALQLGDMLCAVPALRALRRAHPHAHIALAGLPWAASFVERYAHLLDELIVFPGAIGFPEQEETDAHLPAFFGTLSERRFDLAIQLHGSGGVANDIVEGIGARMNAGFLKPDEPMREGTFMPWPDELPEPARYTALMQRLGIDADALDLDIPLTDDDTRECDALIDACAIDRGKLVLVHPGAQLPSRRWPVERFGDVARALSNAGWQIAVTGGAGESPLTARVASDAGARAIDLAGRTSLGALAALVARARLIVCNDTGLSHVAAAMRTPSVVIASGSDTRRWAPLDRARHCVLADWPACRPCAFRDCPYGHECAFNISVQAVLDAACAQLENIVLEETLHYAHD